MSQVRFYPPEMRHTLYSYTRDCNYPEDTPLSQHNSARTPYQFLIDQFDSVFVRLLVDSPSSVMMYLTTLPIDSIEKAKETIYHLCQTKSNVVGKAKKVVRIIITTVTTLYIVAAYSHGATNETNAIRQGVSLFLQSCSL